MILTFPPLSQVCVTRVVRVSPLPFFVLPTVGHPVVGHGDIPCPLNGGRFEFTGIEMELLNRICADLLLPFSAHGSLVVP